MASPKRDKASLATKADITAIMSELGKLYDANERWKDELKGHFDVTVENIRHDLTSANREEIQAMNERARDHARRIGRLEVRAGMA